MNMTNALSYGAGALLLVPFIFFDLFECPQQDPRIDPAAHHYVYEDGQYVPQYYRYDPYPQYHDYSHQFPPHYTARELPYYQGLDRGRVRTYERVVRPFYY